MHTHYFLVHDCTNIKYNTCTASATTTVTILRQDNDIPFKCCRIVFCQVAVLVGHESELIPMRRGFLAF